MHHFSRCTVKEVSSYLLSERGTEMITPLPVPIHNLLQAINMAVILTNEKPSLPVPGNHRHTAI